MKFCEKNFGNGVDLAVYDTKKFKTDNILFAWSIPASEECLTYARVLSAVLGRGTEKYKNLTEINRHLSTLYDAGLDISAAKSTTGKISFKISAVMLDASLSLDGTDIFGGVVDFIYEALYRPLVVDGKMDGEYTESEKRHLIELINAEKNNKDVYALIRATQIAYEGTPFAINSKTETVERVDAGELYKLLCYIREKCPLTVVFGGNYTEDKAKKLDEALTLIADGRDAFAYEKEDCVTIPCFDEIKDVIETISAKQGRMVLNYHIGQSEDKYAAMVFNEIFGASPVSRLFMNVRERLSLCYYCSSSYVAAISRIVVRSGIDMENREKAIEEINRQIALLSEEGNISCEELEIAKKSLVSSYRAMQDNVLLCCDWYVRRRALGQETDIDRCIEEINAVDVKQVARIAKSLSMQLSYFLDGLNK
jgi:predicted Zn-dependent peptidase